MHRKRVAKKQGTRIHYRTTHLLYGKENVFDSWMSLCEYTMDVAEEEAKRQLTEKLVELMNKIADEMIATAEEYDPQSNDITA